MTITTLLIKGNLVTVTLPPANLPIEDDEGRDLPENRGRNAYRRGEPFWNNPYDPDGAGHQPEFYEAWANGFDAEHRAAHRRATPKHQHKAA